MVAARPASVVRASPHAGAFLTSRMSPATRAAWRLEVAGRAYEDQLMYVIPGRPLAHWGVSCAQRSPASTVCSSYGFESTRCSSRTTL